MQTYTFNKWQDNYDFTPIDSSNERMAQLYGQSTELMVAQVRSILENNADTRLSDLYVWQIGANDAAAIIALVTHYPRPEEHYRSLIKTITALKHVTTEINKYEGEPCLPVNILEAR